MKTGKYIVALISVLLSIGVYGQAKVPVEEYKINGIVVTKIEYNNFVQALQLTEVENTYHCKLTVDGGVNFYDAVDKSGNIYQLTSGTKGGKSFNYIREKLK